MAEPALRDCDVLVIGAGGAGLRAAIEACDAGANVIVLSKSLLGKSQTVMGAALAAAIGTARAPDAWEAHFADTLDGGRQVNQWRMAQLLALEAPERVFELARWGALFGRAADGTIRLGEGSGHRHARLARAGQHNTGLELLRTLQAQVHARGIEVLVEHTVEDLLVSAGRIAGACAHRKDSGAPVVFRCAAVVLATGGAGKAYAFTSNFYDSTGDGQALALRAGAELMDMEFVQFHPTGMVAPASARGLLVAESIRNLGGVLRNAAGERFMFRYVTPAYRAQIAETENEADAWYDAPSRARRPPELLPRDEVSRAIESEIRAGRGTRSGGVLLDIASRRPASTIRGGLPHMYRQFLDLADVDITAVPMEVAPTCHYMMGGIRVEPDSCATRVPGLFAAGEVAAGLHGANRLNGNGISELLVFGRRAGRHAAVHALGSRQRLPLDTVQVTHAQDVARRSLQRARGEDPYVLLHELQRVMQERVALVRDQPGLEKALEHVRDIAMRADLAAAPGGAAANAAWQCALDLRSLCAVAEAIVRSALLRRETRGAHVRVDHLQSDAALGEMNVVCRLAGARLDARSEARMPVPQALRTLFGADEAPAPA